LARCWPDPAVAASRTAPPGAEAGECLGRYHPSTFARSNGSARRLGSLFINGGGPGEQIEGLVDFYPSLPAVLRKRFNIIFFDPRGFGYSTAVRCFPDAAAEQKFLSALPPFPVGSQQDAAWERAYARFDARCAKTHSPLLDHDTSTGVARDMNLLRAAVGDPVLNYLGVSYGTGLGAIYANLFPSRVGRMAKRKVSVTLDADLVAALEADSGTTVSAEMNSALQAEFTRRKRQHALAGLPVRDLVKDSSSLGKGSAPEKAEREPTCVIRRRPHG
jgi:pimeloyl-ACP methyl ester carboxylesterase